MKVLSGKKILIISTEFWNHNLLSKHHLATALAKLNNKVFFLNPPSKENERRPVQGTDDLFLINYKPKFRGLRFFPFVVASWLSRNDVKRIKKLASSDFDVVWTFDPFRFQNINLFHAHWNIYHIADAHIAKYEKNLGHRAQLILAPSANLLEKFEPSKSVCIGHMISNAFIEKASMFSPRQPGRIRIGYVGNLMSHFIDYSLLVQVVIRNPSLDFFFIGDDEKISGNFYWNQIVKKPNVYFDGVISHENLAVRLKEFDMLWCCYDTGKYLREASNSHKILEYLATGKPVLSTRIAYYLKFDEILCMPLKNDDLPDLINKIAFSLEIYSSAAEQKRRLDFVRAHTFERRLLEIDDLLVKS